jgi:precorrin-2 dehydrogenase/sirohydrochlorin ferrochelatase
MALFPLFVKLEARKCVVVGGGRIATAKATGLLRHGARVVVIAPQATNWIRVKARTNQLVWRQRTFRAKDVEGAFLMVAATNSTAVNEAVFRACRAHGVLCNVVDCSEHCDFFYPAVVRRGPLQIAISTGGRSPSLARRLRLELERQFGPEYGEWVEHVGRARKQILSRRLPAVESRKQMDQITSREALEQFLKNRASAKAQGRREKKRHSETRRISAE